MGLSSPWIGLNPLTGLNTALAVLTGRLHIRVNIQTRAMEGGQTRAMVVYRGQGRRITGAVVVYRRQGGQTRDGGV